MDVPAGRDGQLTFERAGQALGEWQAREVRIARGFAECKGLSTEQIEDVYQETALALLDRTYPSEEQLRNALRIGIKHRALHSHRDERRHTEILEENAPQMQLLAQLPENEHAPEHLTLARADRLIVQEFLTELTMTERHVFALLADGLRPHLIAASLGIAFNEARNATRACERKRERFQLLYDTGRLCGYRAATIRALQEGGETSEELAERAFAHLESCQRCCTEHQTNAKRLRRAFRDQATILLPPLLTSRLGWLTRLVRRVRHVRRSVNQHATAAQGSVHQRLAAQFARAYMSAKASTVIATVAVMAGGAAGTTHVLGRRVASSQHGAAVSTRPRRDATGRRTRMIRSTVSHTPIAQRHARHAHRRAPVTREANSHSEPVDTASGVIPKRQRPGAAAYRDRAAIEFGPERTPPVHAQGTLHG